jgi:hypothetical protein
MKEKCFPKLKELKVWYIKEEARNIHAVLKLSFCKQFTHYQFKNTVN